MQHRIVLCLFVSAHSLKISSISPISPTNEIHQLSPVDEIRQQRAKYPCNSFAAITPCVQTRPGCGWCMSTSTYVHRDDWTPRVRMSLLARRSCSVEHCVHARFRLPRMRPARTALAFHLNTTLHLARARALALSFLSLSLFSLSLSLFLSRALFLSLSLPQSPSISLALSLPRCVPSLEDLKTLFTHTSHLSLAHSRVSTHTVARLIVSRTDSPAAWKGPRTDRAGVHAGAAPIGDGIQDSTTSLSSSVVCLKATIRHRRMVSGRKKSGRIRTSSEG